MKLQPYISAVFVHLAFHLVWVFLLLLGSLGIYSFIPIVGWYQAFILGFLGPEIISSPLKSIIAGFALFACSGFVAALILSWVKPRHIFLPSILSLVPLIGAFIFLSYSLAPTYVAKEDPMSLDLTEDYLLVQEIGTFLKMQYYFNHPRVPLFLEGEPPIVPLARLRQEFTRLGASRAIPVEEFLYLNLPPAIWQQLKAEVARDYPIAWRSGSTFPKDVLTINLSSDAVDVRSLTVEAFQEEASRVEALLTKRPGYESFELVSE